MERNLCVFREHQPSEEEEQQEQRQLSPPRHAMSGNDGVFWGDLLVEVMSRLPVRHLLRLRCVCKSWRTLIDDIYFIKRHYQLQCSKCKAERDIPLFSYAEPLTTKETNAEKELEVCVLSKQNDHVPRYLTSDLANDSMATFADDPDAFRRGTIVGVVNGIVCFLWDYQNIALWNPATREFKALAPWIKHRQYYHRYIDLIGFGFDCTSNDFKILRGFCFGNRTLGHELYSLSTNSWTTLSKVSPLVRTFQNCPFMQAYLNGVYYWSYDYSGTPRIIVSFNFHTEVFEVFNPPEDAIGSNIGFKYHGEIKMFKECLAFLVTSTDLARAVLSFDVWVATEFTGDSGIPVSWQHVLTIGTFPFSDDLILGAFKMDGDVIFAMSPNISDEFVLYNPSTGTYKNLGILQCRSFNYVESLFPLSKIHV